MTSAKWKVRHIPSPFSIKLGAGSKSNASESAAVPAAACCRTPDAPERGGSAKPEVRGATPLGLS